MSTRSLPCPKRRRSGATSPAGSQGSNVSASAVLGPSRRATFGEQAQEARHVAARDQVAQPHRQVAEVARQRLVAALAVEQHLEPVRVRQLHHLPLREEPRPGRGLALARREAVERRPEVAAVRHHHVRARAARLDGRAHPGALVEVRALVVGAGEGVHRVRQQARGGGHDRARVEPAREARAHLDVGAQPQAHGVGEEPLELARLLPAVAGRAPRLQRPPALDREAALPHHEVVRRRQAQEPFEERARVVVHPVERQQVADGLEPRHDAALAA